MARTRALSQRIAEGDGIAVIVWVGDAEAARAAEAQGAKAIAVDHPIVGIREATALPLLWIGGGEPVDADARTIRPEDDPPPGDIEQGDLEHVVTVRDEDELERALEELDPEIFLLSTPDGDENGDPLDAVLELLPDVPAGKLAIAHVDVVSREEVLALERAGIDAVLVSGGDVTDLVGEQPPDV